MSEYIEYFERHGFGNSEQILIEGSGFALPPRRHREQDVVDPAKLCHSR